MGSGSRAASAASWRPPAPPGRWSGPWSHRRGAELVHRHIKIVEIGHDTVDGGGLPSTRSCQRLEALVGERPGTSSSPTPGRPARLSCCFGRATSSPWESWRGCRPWRRRPATASSGLLDFSTLGGREARSPRRSDHYCAEREFGSRRTLRIWVADETLGERRDRDVARSDPAGAKSSR